jgi:hypothetical protein
MLNDDDIAVAWNCVDESDFSRISGPYRCPQGGLNINAVVFHACRDTIVTDNLSFNRPYESALRLLNGLGGLLPSAFKKVHRQDLLRTRNENAVPGLYLRCVGYRVQLGYFLKAYVIGFAYSPQRFAPAHRVVDALLHSPGRRLNLERQRGCFRRCPLPGSRPRRNLRIIAGGKQKRSDKQSCEPMQCSPSHRPMRMVCYGRGAGPMKPAATETADARSMHAQWRPGPIVPLPAAFAPQ